MVIKIIKVILAIGLVGGLLLAGVREDHLPDQVFIADCPPTLRATRALIKTRNQELR